MNFPTKNLSVVVPCYNEGANLLAVLRRFREALAGRSDVELILVNNGSRDHSALILAHELAKPEFAFARAVDVPVNQGYGYGILCGLRAAQGEYLAWTHADMQTDPVDVVLGFDRLLARPNPERCLLRGRRVGRPLVDRLFTRGMGWVASVALGTRLVDINAQPKIFHHLLLAEMDDAPSDFSLDLYLLYLAHSRNYLEIEQPVEFGQRVHGQAKGGGSLLGKVRLTRRTLAYIFRLREQLRTAKRPDAEVDRRVAA
jgi:glycosyltransferase involved in cell wall biosynthesis